MKKTLFDNYIKGERKGKEAYELERLSQNDPFLAEAIDGFDSVEGDHHANIAKMRQRVADRVVASKKQKAFMYWRPVAVCVVLSLLIGGGYFLMLDEKSSNKKYSTASASSESIELYIPEKYIEKKDAKIMEGKGFENRPVENIENLEILDVEKDIFVYLPENYEDRQNKLMSADVVPSVGE